MLKIMQYPVVWWYSRNLYMPTIKRGHFVLPSGNMYTKGVSDKNMVGNKGQAGLPNITGKLYGAKGFAGIFGTEGSGSGALRSSDYGGHVYLNSGGLSGQAITINASLSNPIYKDNYNKVEVHRVHLLEGYYVGE